MILYIIALLAFLSIIRGARLVLIKRKHYNDKPHPGTRTIFHKRGKVGVLLIHGYSSSPLDLKPLASYLTKKKYTVIVPLLKGHGTTPANLATTTDVDWKASVEDAYRKLSKYTNQIFIVGHSVGGNLAVDLTSRYPAAGLISVGTPIFFKRERYFRAVLFLLGFFRVWKSKNYSKDYITRINKQRFVYTKIPFNTAKYVIKILKETIKNLRRVQCPALIIQATHDEAVDERSVTYISNHIGSRDKELFWAPAQNHLFIMDPETREPVFKRIADFIRSKAL